MINLDLVIHNLNNSVIFYSSKSVFEKAGMCSHTLRLRGYLEAFLLPYQATAGLERGFYKKPPEMN